MCLLLMGLDVDRLVWILYVGLVGNCPYQRSSLLYNLHSLFDTDKGLMIVDCILFASSDILETKTKTVKTI